MTPGQSQAVKVAITAMYSSHRWDAAASVCSDCGMATSAAYRMAVSGQHVPPCPRMSLNAVQQLSPIKAQQQAAQASTPIHSSTVGSHLYNQFIPGGPWTCEFCLDVCANGGKISNTVCPGPALFDADVWGSGIFDPDYAGREPKCECGGKTAGVQDYAVGHADWCDVAEGKS